MALVAQPAMTLGEKQEVHPFFDKTQRSDLQTCRKLEQESGSRSRSDRDDPTADYIDEIRDAKQTNKPRGSGKRGRSSKRKSEGQQVTLLDRLAQRGGPNGTASGAPEAPTAAISKEVEVPHEDQAQVSVEDNESDASRRKRRKFSPVVEIGKNNRSTACHDSGKGLGKGTSPSSPPEEIDQENGVTNSIVEILPRPKAQHASSRQSLLDPGLTTPGEMPSPTSSRSPASHMKTESTPHDTMPPSSPITGSESGSRRSLRLRPAQNQTPKKVQEEAPPQKMLRLNATGRFSSPVSNKPKTGPELPETKAKRGRTSKKNQHKELLLKLHYGSEEAQRLSVGDKIERILRNEFRHVPAPRPKSSPRKVKPSGPPKPTHPFFTGKKMLQGEVPNGASEVSERPTNETPKAIPRQTTATPGKLMAEARLRRKSMDFPSFGATSNQAKTLKYPGMADAPWPWNGITHVRDESGTDSVHFSDKTRLSISHGGKHKGAEVTGEDLLTNLSRRLKSVLKETAFDSSGFTVPPKSVRLPKKQVMPGSSVQGTLQTQLVCPVAKDYFADLSSTPPVHAALAKLWREIGNGLTAFDRNDYETQAWTTKYAPRRVEEVMQPGKEAVIMGNWLKALTVSVVEGAKPEGPKSTPKKKQAKKRKRKKAEELDDFIVSSGADDDDMDKLTDQEDVPSMLPCSGTAKSVVRTGSGKPKNAVLISGPHGSGKSAAVYAVAKEMGYEVFEINASSRRNGRDILDKVGDMTENHLVQHGQGDAELPGMVDSDVERVDTAFQNDVDSGRQGMMTAFFKADQKPAPKPKPKSKPLSAQVKAISSALEKPRTKRHQKQSLILLEEVDILFEEDKPFWTTVISLAVQSRRPIILTCNNESLVPLEDLPLHAILRFTQPPIDVVADFLLLMAANEGHLLKRSAIVDLYGARGRDLRASITELNFWCQMAVGDRKGGLDWLLTRWPEGSDKDEHGRTLHTVSEGTYDAGMGWLGHDTIHSYDQIDLADEGEVLGQMWADWGMEPEDGLAAIYPGQPSHDQEISPKSNLDLLKNAELSAETSSEADTCCKIGIPRATTQETLMDPSQPPLAVKYHSDFISGYAVLQTDFTYDYHNLDTSIAVTMHQLAHRICHPQTNRLLPAELEHRATRAIAERPSKRLDNPAFVARSLADAFSPISQAPSNPFAPAVPLTQFDRPLTIVTTELAPYVRTICAFDIRLQAQRLQLSGLLSEGGRLKKKARTTKASRSALEGGKRDSTRRERWFKDCPLNLQQVLGTAGREWAGLGGRVCDVKEEDTGDELIIPKSSQETGISE